MDTDTRKGKETHHFRHFRMAMWETKWADMIEGDGGWGGTLPTEWLGTASLGR